MRFVQSTCERQSQSRENEIFAVGDTIALIMSEIAGYSVCSGRRLRCLWTKPSMILTVHLTSQVLERPVTYLIYITWSTRSVEWPGNNYNATAWLLRWIFERSTLYSSQPRGYSLAANLTPCYTSTVTVSLADVPPRPSPSTISIQSIAEMRSCSHYYKSFPTTLLILLQALAGLPLIDRHNFIRAHTFVFRRLNDSLMYRDCLVCHGLLDRFCNVCISG